jgi:hypothetical protein
MARIRTIKPEFWTDEKTGTLSPVAQCLFIGLWNHADDYGLLSWSPREYSARVLPYLENALEQVERALEDELIPRGLVRPFALAPTPDGPRAQYLLITQFARHQRVDKPGKPLIDGWRKGDSVESFAARENADSTNAREDSRNPREDSRALANVPAGKERKGKEGKGEYWGATPAESPQQSHADDPDDGGGGKAKAKSKRFVPPSVEEVAAYCRERANGIDPQHFVDYHIARGWILSNGRKMVDWKGAVRTWEKNQQQRSPPPSRTSDLPADAY